MFPAGCNFNRIIRDANILYWQKPLNIIDIIRILASEESLLYLNQPLYIHVWFCRTYSYIC